MGSADEKLVLADIPERALLRELVAKLEERRDRIAEIDLELETLRGELATFESAYHARLAEEHHRLSRVEELVRHVERWSELLRARPASELGKKARRMDTRRARELGKTPRRTAPPPAAAVAEETVETETEAEEEPLGESRRTRLKAAYRALARRFHPDLARTEEERLRFSATMSRINLLYKAGDLDRLVAMAEQAKGAEIDDPELPVPEQLAMLGERLTWFDAVLENLGEERTALERSPTCELWRNVQQAEAAGRDLLDELRSDLRGQVDRAYKNIPEAVRDLESQVADYNRQNVGAPPALARRQSKGALERLFDPYADKRLVRRGLEQVNLANLSKQARELADWLETEGPLEPHVLRLVLLCHVAELSPFPLRGLESYEDLALRFTTLGAADEKPVTLEQALVDADDLVEFGVRRATDKVAHIGLRFRSATARDAVPAALGRLPVRRAFRSVLGVLGDHSACSGCKEHVFAVPLYRLRGLDDLRASVCPRCGHTLSSYWMPKGKDVQAVLNAAFLDYEIVSEWRFRLGRGSIAMQLVPCQVEAMTIKELRARFYDDVFAKNDIEVDRRHVLLLQGKERLPDKTPLLEIEEPSFTIRFDEAAKLDAADALELLRHRIRNRFKA